MTVSTPTPPGLTPRHPSHTLTTNAFTVYLPGAGSACNLPRATRVPTAAAAVVVIRLETRVEDSIDCEQGGGR